jgi:hypothetical protein
MNDSNCASIPAATIDPKSCPASSTRANSQHGAKSRRRASLAMRSTQARALDARATLVPVDPRIAAQCIVAFVIAVADEHQHRHAQQRQRLERDARVRADAATARARQGCVGKRVPASCSDQQRRDALRVRQRIAVRELRAAGESGQHHAGVRVDAESPQIGQRQLQGLVGAAATAADAEQLLVAGRLAIEARCDQVAAQAIGQLGELARVLGGIARDPMYCDEHEIAAAHILRDVMHVTD